MLTFFYLQDLHSTMIILISRFKIMFEHNISNNIFCLLKENRSYVQYIFFRINQSYKGEVK